MKSLVTASVMCADMLNLESEIERLKRAGVDWLHIDVMDGNFVPNFVNGCPTLIRDLKDRINLPVDVHLMIQEPERHIESYAKAGADYLVVHAETTNHMQRVLTQIRSLGVKAGIALNPFTPIAGLDYVFDDLDMILIMTVNPGFSGQSFIDGMVSKIKETRVLANGQKIHIEVDGGLTLDRIVACADAGANVFVAGTSSIFEKQLKRAKSRVRDNAKEIINQIHLLSIGTGS